jgi:kynureninase
MEISEAVGYDAADELAGFRSDFLIPQHKGNDTIYVCGNSLGLQPKSVQENMQVHLDKWASQGVEGHFTDPLPWLSIDDTVQESMARLVGAQKDEIVMMNSLTCNLHLMMVRFYMPTALKYKIIIEKKAFPSDVHAVMSQIKYHGYDPHEALIEVSARKGETCLRMEDIEECIHTNGDSVALVLFSGVQYFTGQAFDLERITTAAHAHHCHVGFDLAHAVGNILLQLHDWDCDFACWCSYKYMNCGPGSIGGCFVHEKFSLTNLEAPSFNGWWGHQVEDRFEMKPEFRPAEGAYGYRLSNPPVLLIACVRASLDIFDRVLTTTTLYIPSYTRVHDATVSLGWDGEYKE